jgi:glycosyltransferase involved in cell wall biosynthesis
LGNGCAILALNTPFNQEMLQNGKHGWYFEKTVKGVKTLVEMAEAESGKLDMLRKTAREGLTEKYSWERVTEQYLDVFKGLAKN